jgi:hypothetical protein
MMSKSVTALSAVVLVVGTVIGPTQLLAAMDATKAALQPATATCKAQVKEYARYHETSWYARHKMVKNCVKDALAKK